MISALVDHSEEIEILHKIGETLLTCLDIDPSDKLYREYLNLFLGLNQVDDIPLNTSEEKLKAETIARISAAFKSDHKALKDPVAMEQKMEKKIQIYALKRMILQNEAQPDQCS